MATVVVVGSGLAGLSAAIEALDTGAIVYVVEKAPKYDGSSYCFCGETFTLRPLFY